jgi:hypothetical protein
MTKTLTIRPVFDAATDATTIALAMGNAARESEKAGRFASAAYEFRLAARFWLQADRQQNAARATCSAVHCDALAAPARKAVQS